MDRASLQAPIETTLVARSRGLGDFIATNEAGLANGANGRAKNGH
jgi:hypothetical protein